jgi:hypothetical protein
MLDYNNELDKLYNQKEWYLKHSELSSLIEGWPIPSRVEIEGKSLIYNIVKYGERLEPDQATMRREILGGFLELADANDQAILEYARKWGVLGLCKHGLPAAHSQSPDRKLKRFILEKPGCTITRKGDWLYEPLDRWRYYARQFRSIITLASELHKAHAKTKEEFQAALKAFYEARQAAQEGRPHDKRHLLDGQFKLALSKQTGAKRSSTVPKVEISKEIPGKVEDWQIVLQDYFRPYSWGSPDPVIGARGVLCTVINRLLDISGVEPRVWWARETRFVLSSRVARGFIFPTLAVQLMLLVNGSPDYALCSSCSKPILLRKGQSISRKSYCTDCGPKAARREAVKKYYRAERANPERKKRGRLKAKEVQTIQRLLKKSKPGLVKELAKRYGVSEWAIYKIREGKTWKNSE